MEIYGANGLAYIKVNDAAKPNEEGPAVADRQVPAPPTCCSEILARTGAQTGDLIFFGADREKVVNDALGALRAKVGHDRGFAIQRLEAAVGRRLPDVRIQRRDEGLGARGTIRSPRRRTATRTMFADRSGQARSPRPTTSC